MTEETYKENILKENKNPKNNHKIIKPTHQGEHNNHVCGDVIKIELRINNDKIQDAGWTGKGCALCIASASLLTQHLKNKTTKQANNLNTADIETLIKIHPPQSRTECILTPLIALKNLISKIK